MDSSNFQPDPAAAFSTRLVFVTGKGGVGKSLVSAAAALCSARQGRRTLWVEMSESPRGGELFPGYRPRYEMTRVRDHLHALNFSVDEAIEEYLALMFKLPFITRMIAKNSLFQALTAALPGIESLIPLGKLWYEFERTANGRPHWDRIIVDAPATGHALSMFRFPQAALDIAQSGNLADRCRDIDRMLRDPAKTSLVLVSTLEELAVEETLELIEKLHRDTPYRVDSIFCNATLPDIGKDQSQRFGNWLRGASDGPIAQTLGSAEARVRKRLQWLEARRLEQQARLPKLRQSRLPLYSIPWFPAVTDRQLLDSIAQKLAEA
ncbi:MAG: ArsA family ATPase [Wenzhouxiangellaceae bacterium]|nr:ArsA family ATPase [Wenzhouxiangellaceae bacterium]